MDDTTSDTSRPELDIDSAVDSIGQDLFASVREASETEAAPDDAPDLSAPSEPVLSHSAESEVAPATVRTPPKSWGKEHHESWGKIDSKAQDYIEKREKQMLDGMSQYTTDASYGKSLRDIISPYRPMLASSGLDETSAVQTLMNAHYRLTQGDMANRKQAFYELGQNLGFLTPQQQQEVDPQVQSLQSRLDSIQNSLQARDNAAMSETRVRIEKEVETFASDPAHPYFDEVADDVIQQIHLGAPLQVAYEKAVWANDVTRQRQIAHLQTEHEAKLREGAKQKATKARQASGVNMNGREVRRTPTEPTGSMDDTMANTLAAIKSRTH
jgi:hypothetical protein